MNLKLSLTVKPFVSFEWQIGKYVFLNLSHLVCCPWQSWDTNPKLHWKRLICIISWPKNEHYCLCKRYLVIYRFCPLFAFHHLTESSQWLSNCGAVHIEPLQGVCGDQRKWPQVEWIWFKLNKEKVPPVVLLPFGSWNVSAFLKGLRTTGLAVGISSVLWHDLFGFRIQLLAPCLCRRKSFPQLRLPCMKCNWKKNDARIVTRRFLRMHFERRKENDVQMHLGRS